MKIAKIEYKKRIWWGRVENGYVRVLSAYTPRKRVFSSRTIPVKKVKFLAPAIPQKIILVGLNYKDHARELKMKIPREPIIFLKPPSALIGHKDTIFYPPRVKRLDYEGELAVVMGKEAKNISPRAAKKYILGYTCLNDVTARDIQKKDGQWTRAKSFDTFCPLGPWIETDINPDKLYIKTYLNGKIKQDSSTDNFIFPVFDLVSFVSKVMTLYPGDVISTGTPPGVGPMKRGDTVEVEIENIGILRNYVA